MRDARALDHRDGLLELYRLPDGRLVEIADSYTVIPLDQPQQLADAVRTFITSTAGPPR